MRFETFARVNLIFAVKTIPKNNKLVRHIAALQKINAESLKTGLAIVGLKTKKGAMPPSSGASRHLLPQGEKG
jgi:hypothetical protein